MMCSNNAAALKHFEVSSDKHMGLGEKTKDVLLETWQKAVGNKVR